MDEQMRKKLGFEISDDTYPVRVLTYVSGGCHPASDAEIALWDALAALSQPAAQGDSSHPAGGDGGGVPAPNMELVNLARRAIDKHWDFETLKYGDDLYGKMHLADAVWDFVEECQAIGRTAFDKKYLGAA